MKTHKIHWIHCSVEGYISLYWAFSMEWIISRSVPHSGGSDDPDKQDSTPAQGMRCLEHENVLQEEGVQFRKLWTRIRRHKHFKHSFRRNKTPENLIARNVNAIYTVLHWVNFTINQWIIKRLQPQAVTNLPDDHEEINPCYSLEGRFGVKPAHVGPASWRKLQHSTLDLPCSAVDVPVHTDTHTLE